MKIEFDQPVIRPHEPTWHIYVDGERVGYITKYVFRGSYSVEWALPLDSNWPPVKAAQIRQAADDKIAALNVAARLRK